MNACLCLLFSQISHRSVAVSGHYWVRYHSFLPYLTIYSLCHLPRFLFHYLSPFSHYYPSTCFSNFESFGKLAFLWYQYFLQLSWLICQSCKFFSIHFYFGQKTIPWLVSRFSQVPVSAAQTGHTSPTTSACQHNITQLCSFYSAELLFCKPWIESFQFFPVFFEESWHHCRNLARRVSCVFLFHYTFSLRKWHPLTIFLFDSVNKRFIQLPSILCNFICIDNCMWREKISKYGYSG